MKSFNLIFGAIIFATLVILTTTPKLSANTDTPGSIGGTVTDAITDLPLASAVVTLQTGYVVIATTTTNAAGKYLFSNVVGADNGSEYDLRAYSPGYAPSDFVSATLGISEAHSAVDIAVRPLVRMKFTPPPVPYDPLTYTFYNDSYRDVTVVAWGYECRNIYRCDPTNTQTSWASTLNRSVLAISPGRSANFVLQRKKIRRKIDEGFDAQVSFCYFTSFDLPYKSHAFHGNLADTADFGDVNAMRGISFDVVTWPAAPHAPASCRTLLTPPPSDFP